MYDPNKIKDLARNRARNILANNDTFKNMNVEDQKKMYVSVVEDQIESLKNEMSNGGQLSTAKKASENAFGFVAYSLEIREITSAD